MADNRGDELPVDHDATAAYLATLLGELTLVAQRNGLPVVAYLLDMALMEAKTAAGQSVEPHDGSR